MRMGMSEYEILFSAPTRRCVKLSHDADPGHASIIVHLAQFFGEGE